MLSLQEQMLDVAEFLQQSKRIVVLTGAGISTESGIPDFRSPGSRWQEYPPVTYHAFLNHTEARQRYWETRRTFSPLVSQARPNAAHLALTEFERQGILLAVITQNFDGLHQDAGLPPERVIELHGTSREAACQECGARSSIEELQQRIEAGEQDPRCPLCSGLLKAATILFGQRVPDNVLEKAKELTIQSDLFIVIGSSLKVSPASNLPRLAVKHKIPLIVINLQPTTLDDLADVVIYERAGEVLPQILDLTRHNSGQRLYEE